MGKINVARVIGGGLLAGLVINVFEFLVNGIWLEKDWVAAMQALGKPATNSPAMIVGFNIWGFLMGILAVWLYAAIRPRFGAGPGTAMIAAIGVWIPGYLLSMIPPAMMGMFPIRLMLIGVVVGLLEVVVGTQLGANVYKEEAAAGGRAASATAGR